MPGLASPRLGLQPPLTIEDNDAPPLAQLLIDRLENAVGMVKLASLSPTSGGFNGVSLAAYAPANFRHLRMVLSAKATVGTDPNEKVVLRFNGNATLGNYGFAWSYADEANAGSFADGTGLHTYMGVSFINTVSGVFTTTTIDVFDYKSANQKLVRAEGVHVISSAVRLTDMAGRWNQTAAITSFDLISTEQVTGGTSRLDAASRLDLYGIV